MDRIEFTLPIKVTSKMSFNKVYAGEHWSKRSKEAETYHNFVKYELMKQKIPRETWELPVEIIFLYNSGLDIDNHAYIDKLIIDGLKGYLIKDDSKKYVRRKTDDYWDGAGIKVIVREYSPLYSEV
jgi:hypothetical protein